MVLHANIPHLCEATGGNLRIHIAIIIYIILGDLTVRRYFAVAKSHSQLH